MPHSHLPIEHLLQALEQTRGRVRERRPEWLVQVVDEICDLFEPYDDVARVGFECAPAEEAWELAMYVGRTEVVGGPRDGVTQVLPFRFDLHRLLDRFSRIDHCEWHALPPAEGRDDRSFVLIDGQWGEHPLSLRIFALPPANAGPGLRQFPDGRCEPV